MKIFVAHHHLRPGGVRRVIELATPHLVAHWPERVRAVVLVTGEVPNAVWLRNFHALLKGTPVEIMLKPAFGYASELHWSPRKLQQQVAQATGEVVAEARREGGIIWAHNLGLGRNLDFAKELTAAAHAAQVRLVAHHHDWWFENRWHHLAALEKPAFRRLPTIARAVLATSPAIAHVAINQTDARVLAKHFPGRAGWLPNPVEPAPLPAEERITAARHWLSKQIGESAPVWLVPCRMLRRKNIAEALLLTRWLRPEAWLLTTAGVSSLEEQSCFESLTAAAHQHGWPLRIGILSANEHRKPSVAELMAASEAIIMTSVQEGFGLPYLEAVAAKRPLLARKLPNISPDLARLGFKFPQTYEEVLVDPALFNWANERKRQTQRFAAWKKLMPRAAANLAGHPALLTAGANPGPVPFSRLTLTAQLEVLAKPIEYSWARCAALNPFLGRWRRKATAGKLETAVWPSAAGQWLSGRAFARQFMKLALAKDYTQPRRDAAEAAQQEFLGKKLRTEYLYPLLWNHHP